MTDRWCLYKTHKLSHRRNFDIDEFNSLTHEHALVSEQIDRLEDELQVNFRNFWVKLLTSDTFGTHRLAELIIKIYNL